MTVHEAYRQLSVTLQVIYEPREANRIASFVIEALTGLNNTQRIVHRDALFTRQQTTHFHHIVLDLLTNKPVQYILEEAHWFGIKLFVNESVLIPRPETEELVAWCIDEYKKRESDKSCHILDVGTGSGAIAVALQKALPFASVSAVDISEDALQVAAQNAEEQQVAVSFFKVDMLDAEQREGLPSFDCIISNPPYVTEKEANEMLDHVLRFEPHLALFVPDKNPLLFYDAIASFGLTHLHDKGFLFFEINESFGKEVTDLLSAKGYINVELRKDMQGKDRMVKGEKPDSLNQ